MAGPNSLATWSNKPTNPFQPFLSKITHPHTHTQNPRSNFVIFFIYKFYNKKKKKKKKLTGTMALFLFLGIFVQSRREPLWSDRESEGLKSEGSTEEAAVKVPISVVKRLGFSLDTHSLCWLQSFWHPNKENTMKSLVLLHCCLINKIIRRSPNWNLGVLLLLLLLLWEWFLG